MTTTTDKKLNPRYLAYCRANGRTPAEQAAFDEEAWPGGRCCGFQLWIATRWSAFKRARGIYWLDGVSDEQHQEFDRELLRDYPVGEPHDC